MPSYFHLNCHLNTLEQENYVCFVLIKIIKGNLIFTYVFYDFFKIASLQVENFLPVKHAEKRGRDNNSLKKMQINTHYLSYFLLPLFCGPFNL